MNKMQRTLWLLVTVFLGVCLTVIALSYIVTEPWHVFPEIGGDGAKNGFTYLYHSMYGKGYWFDGMNYPYGEHIVFTDGVPLLSVFFAAIGNVSAPVALTVFWWMVGLGYVLGVVYIYKVLLRFGVSPLIAMVAAGIICILTPQWIRIRGHYALSITCIIPMLLYWSVAWHQERRLKYWLYVSFMGAVVSFIHPYYAGLILIWVLAYCVAFVLFEKGPLLKKIKQLAAPIAAGASVPAIFMIVMKLTDHAADRLGGPPMPIEVYTNIKQVVTSYFSPFWKYAVNKSIVAVASDGGEGYSYIGLVPVAVVLLSLPIYIYKRWQKKEAILPPGYSPLWLGMAFGVLAFSMGVPLRWDIPWLMKALFVFKQFRTLGRFAWIFYYLITVFSVVTIYHWFTGIVAAGRKKLALSLLMLAFMVWGTEAFGYIKASRKVADMSRYNYEVMFSVNEKNWKEFLKEHNLSATDFQAILALRFFHIGTDKIWVGDPGWLITLCARASMQLHLPMIDAMMARSSLHHAQDVVKIAAGPYADKPLLCDIESSKPFLLMEYDIDSLSPDQKYLLEAADYIGEFSSCRIYACYPARIIANDKKRTDSVEDILPLMAAGDTCLNCNGTWYVNHYTGGTKETGLWDMGAMLPIKGNDSTIAVIPITAANDSIMYEYSCWFLLGIENYRSPHVDLELQDGTGKTIKTVTVNTSESVDSRGMWFRASKYFYMPAGCKSVKCKLVNTPNPSYIAMDEMVLRPAHAVIISKSRYGMAMVNNHWFKEKRR